MDTFFDFLFPLLNSEKRRSAYSGSSFKRGTKKRRQRSGTKEVRLQQVFTPENKDGKRRKIMIRQYLNLGIPRLPASVFSARNSCWSLPHPREHVVPVTCM